MGLLCSIKNEKKRFVFILTCVFLLIFSFRDAKALCSNADFIQLASVATGISPYSPVVGDFNSDGKPDVATANQSSQTISIKLGDGFGGFTGSTTLTTGAGFYSIAIGDFNKDGKQDIIAALSASNSVSIFLGNGLGGFTFSSNLSVGSVPYFVVVGDFNNDNNQDIATANYTGATVSVRLGNGVGGFGSVSTITVGSGPYCIGLGDFNSDGKVDMVVPNAISNTVSVRFGDGLGGFTGTTNISISTSPRFIVVDDFNGDGKKDFATANTNSNNVSIRLGDGLGGFSGTTNVTVGAGPVVLKIGDFNGDGIKDLVTTSNLTVNSASILIGNGLGGFTLTKTLTPNNNPTGCAVLDFDSDGYQDIIVTSYDNNNFNVWRGVAPLINLVGNGNSIPDGNTVISTTNNTDFGTTNLCTQVVKTFTIQNTGLTSLTINSITLTGMNPSDFTILGISLPFTIAGGGSQVFSVKFIPLAAGVRNATIHVTNTDCRKADYDFALQGNGTLASLAFNSCPLDMSVSAPSGQCRAAVSYTVTLSVSPTPVIAYALTGATSSSGSGTGSGLFFNEGITHVVITATNSCGTGTCAFNITVNANTNDNDACTIDACDAITGVSHLPVNPDDGNSCTLDGCNPLTGVFHTPVTEICGNGIDDDCDGMIDENCNVVLNLKLYIQGFYIGNNTMLATVNASAYPLICDTMRVELHSASGPYNLLYADTALMNIHGESSFVFPLSLVGNSYYIVTKHRNALETWSSGPVLFGSAVVNYSFKDSLQEAYGNNLFDLGDGNFALWSGDVSINATNTNGIQDGLIDIRDYNYMELNVYSTTIGYTPADLTGDGIVESLDYVLMENAFYFMVATIRP